MQKSALYASVLLNIALVVSFAFFVARSHVAGVSTSEASVSSIGVERVAAKIDKDADSETAKARSSVLSGSQIKMLRLQELKHAYLSSVPLPRDKYWIAAPATETADYISLQMNGLAEVRKHLIEEFGPEAKSAPEFSEVFRPLAPQHNYLSAEEQIALREFQLRKQIDFLRHPSSSVLNDAMQIGMAASPIARNEELEKVLSSDSRFEYNLRTSPLAARLRNLGLDVTEQKFREMYRIFENYAQDSSVENQSRNDLLASKLASLLGKQSTVKVLANLDPRFEAIKKAGAKNQLTEQQLYSTYEIFVETDRSVLEAHALRGKDPMESKRRMQRAMSDRRQSLARLLGDLVAEDMLQSHRELQRRAVSPASALN